MEGLVFFLIVVIVVLILFLFSFVHDCSYYKGHAEAYERMLRKAGMIDDAPEAPPITNEETE